MKTIYLPLIIIISILFSSCNSEEGVQTISIDKRYSLTIPSFLSESDDLHGEASLQYQNIFNEFYVVVIEEPKDGLQKALETYELTDTYTNDIDGYAKLAYNGIYSSLENPTQTEIIDTNVNALNTRLTTINGKIDGLSIFYAFGVYDSQDRYYQVIAWTLSEKKSKYKSKMDAILQSLIELKIHRKKSY